MEERIFNYATPIVSFLRLGDNLKMSKSLFINKTLFDKNFQVFQDLRSTAAQTPLSHVGMVDAAWVAPQNIQNPYENKEKMMMLLNLHGDADSERVEETVKFLCAFSQVIVIFAASYSEVFTKIEKLTNTFSSDQKYSKISTMFQKMRYVVVCREQSKEDKEKLDKFTNNSIFFVDYPKSANYPDWFFDTLKSAIYDQVKIQLRIYKKLAKEQPYWKTMSLREICDEVVRVPNIDITVDQNKDQLKEPIDQAEKLFKIINNHAQKGKMAFGAIRSHFLVFQECRNRGSEEQKGNNATKKFVADYVLLMKKTIRLTNKQDFTS